MEASCTDCTHCLVKVRVHSAAGEVVGTGLIGLVCDNESNRSILGLRKKIKDARVPCSHHNFVEGVPDLLPLYVMDSAPGILSDRSRLPRRFTISVPEYIEYRRKFSESKMKPPIGFAKTVGQILNAG